MWRLCHKCGSTSSHVYDKTTDSSLLCCLPRIKMASPALSHMCCVPQSSLLALPFASRLAVEPPGGQVLSGRRWSALRHTSAGLMRLFFRLLFHCQHLDCIRKRIYFPEVRIRVSEHVALSTSPLYVQCPNKKRKTKKKTPDDRCNLEPEGRAANKYCLARPSGTGSPGVAASHDAAFPWVWSIRRWAESDAARWGQFHISLVVLAWRGRRPAADWFGLGFQIYQTTLSLPTVSSRLVAADEPPWNRRRTPKSRGVVLLAQACAFRLVHSRMAPQRPHVY